MRTTIGTSLALLALAAPVSQAAAQSPALYGTKRKAPGLPIVGLP